MIIFAILGVIFIGMAFYHLGGEETKTDIELRDERVFHGPSLFAAVDAVTKYEYINGVSGTSHNKAYTPNYRYV
jgi:hypothetical protein